MSTRSKKSEKKLYRKTFTFFIPAPLQRNTGYREREFDKMVQGYVDNGFEIENIQTQSVGHGIFTIVVFSTSNKKIYSQDSTLDFHEKFKLSESPTSNDIFLEENEHEII